MLFIIGCLVGLYLSFLYTQKRKNVNKVFAYVIGGLVGGILGKFLSTIFATMFFIVIILGLGLVGIIFLKTFIKE